MPIEAIQIVCWPPCRIRSCRNSASPPFDVKNAAPAGMYVTSTFPGPGSHFLRACDADTGEHSDQDEELRFLLDMTFSF